MGAQQSPCGWAAAIVEMATTTEVQTSVFLATFITFTGVSPLWF